MNKIHIRLLGWLFVGLGLLILGGCRSEEYPYQVCFNPEAEEQISIAELKGLLRGEQTAVQRSCYIEGRITANDLFGEFDRSLVVEDASGGIEVLIDQAHLAHDHPLGQAVRIFCEGLCLGNYGGKALLGGPSRGEYVVGRLTPSDCQRHLRPLNEPPQRIEARSITFKDLSLGLVGRFVRIEGWEIVESRSDQTWCDYDPALGIFRATSRHLINASGEELLLYTLGSCHYAEEPLPKGSGSMKGILDYFNGAYQLRIVNRDFQF